MLRVFALADGAQSWRVLPGGMVRLAPNGQQIASMQRGGSSADCWVLTHGEVDRTSLLQSAPSTLSMALQQRHITSRAAENLFWLGRYLERLMERLRLATGTAAPPDDDTLAADLASMRQAASAVRERLTPAQWQGIQKAHDLPSLEALASALAARQHEGSHEDEGWRLFVTGQAIERMASQPESADLAWRLTEDLSARLFTHSDDARQRVGA